MNPGDVVVVRFPFTELATDKKRPALVLAQTTRSPRNRLDTVAMITSKTEALKIPGDVLLGEWELAGLLHPSLLRMAKVATIEEDLIDKKIGHLSAADLGAARKAFQRVFASWLP